MPTDGEAFLEDFDTLTKPGCIGLFDHFELVEVVRFANGNPAPSNVFAIAVALEGGSAREGIPLNDQRIRLSAIKGHSFGVFRSVMSVEDLRQALQNCLLTTAWQPGKLPVSTGSLKPVSKRFVPPTASTDVALNRVLKNNFFNGCYVLELFDVAKQSLQDFFLAPTALQQLSEAVTGVVPLQIASLADRLGNIIVQFPIDAIRTRLGRNSSGYAAEIAWHPKISERPVIVTAYAEHDNLTVAYGQEQTGSGVIELCKDPDYGLLHGSVWDQENGIMLAATAGDAFISSVTMNFSVAVQEPRTIPASIDAADAAVRVKLTHFPIRSQVGNDPKSFITEPIAQRIYEDELATLLKQKKFLQYGARRRSGVSGRQAALSDVRSLVASHGANGVWLWDPYLAPQDLLDTLFHNSTAGAPMRALTLLEAKGVRLTKIDRLKAYGAILSNLPGNKLGLNIEFRSAHGNRGWKFHDRFLIFPKSDEQRAKVWSLGTSVNSLGKSHHIIQQVDHAQLIADAFQALWDAVAHRENVVWQCP